MDAFVSTTIGVLQGLAPMALIFGVLAFVVKRDAFVEALRRSRRETETNLALLVVNYILLATFFASASVWWAQSLAVSDTLIRFWNATSIRMITIWNIARLKTTMTP